MTVTERFWSRVEKDPQGCWLWTGELNPGGYGRVYFEGRKPVAHRVAWLLSGRTIPAGLVLDHLCRVRNCVNPDHLEPVTFAENIRRGRSATGERVSCPRGHPYTPENTYVTPRGSRSCRECHRESNRAYARRIRVGAA